MPIRPRRERRHFTRSLRVVSHRFDQAVFGPCAAFHPDDAVLQLVGVPSGSPIRAKRHHGAPRLPHLRDVLILHDQ
jgi:hypothetical protein